MDENTPIIILFGPPVCGKTRALLRLTRYTENHGYIVEPIANYRPNDDHYQQICENFHCLVYDDNVNIRINYLMGRVSDNKGRSICQILKIPGQICFDPSFPQPLPFAHPITSLFSLPNRRIWMFMQELEDNWQNITIRNAYVGRIHQLSTMLNNNDKVIFVCNKIDKHPDLLLPNRAPDKQAIIRELNNKYNGIFEDFENQNLIIRLFKRYNFTFVPFSAGDFFPTENGCQGYIPGADMYPQQLWKAIIKCIK